jgi:hypothetical protein
MLLEQTPRVNPARPKTVHNTVVCIIPLEQALRLDRRSRSNLVTDLSPVLAAQICPSLFYQTTPAVYDYRQNTAGTAQESDSEPTDGDMKLCHGSCWHKRVDVSKNEDESDSEHPLLFMTTADSEPTDGYMKLCHGSCWLKRIDVSKTRAPPAAVPSFSPPFWAMRSKPRRPLRTADELLDELAYRLMEGGGGGGGDYFPQPRNQSTTTSTARDACRKTFARVRT